MRIACAVLALFVLSPLAASAQARVVVPGGTMASLGSGGITEQGHAGAAIPADRLTFFVRVYNRQPAPVAANAAPMNSSEMEKSVVALMHDNGIADAHIVEAVLGNVSANDQIVGTIAKPTRAKVADFERRVITAMPVSMLPALANVNVDGAFEVDSCAAAIERLRAAAYRDARSRADSFAKAAGVHVGALLAATENDQTAGCTDFGAPEFYNNNIGGAFNNPLTDGSLPIGVSVNATFAIVS